MCSDLTAEPRETLRNEETRLLGMFRVKAVSSDETSGAAVSAASRNSGIPTWTFACRAHRASSTPRRRRATRKLVEESSDAWKLAAISSFSVLAVVLVGAALIIGVMLHRRKSHKLPLREPIEETAGPLYQA
ncbi:uncharacterized protein si:rp71-1c10.7 isoform X1 [Phyllopteryx taeniolatus]|uniref:uncharacterized protein si:rp71-1c10.7 isoform X1 n=1 Tax=Phyllopteryx taeniolatus TaxID=161469 RepID=UPI002AD26AC3|nr:uncharacterized protein si:rp71-1c10.7 isoform X1 [Phyllopteryx taeniolatus]